MNINARLRQTCKQNWIVAPVLGLPGCHSEKWWKRCRYAELIRLCISMNWQCLRLSVVHCPPAFPDSVEKRSSRSFTSVQMFHTHPFSQEYLILISLSQSHRIHVWYLGHVDFHHLHRTKHGRSGRARAGHGISRSLWRWMHSTVHVRYMGMGQNLLLPYWGNKHSLTSYFRVPMIPGFWGIAKFEKHMFFCWMISVQIIASVRVWMMDLIDVGRTKDCRASCAGVWVRAS